MRRFGVMASVVLLAVLSTSPSAAGGGTQAVVLVDQLYSTRENLRLYADVYIPEGIGPFPMVVTIHSGSWQRGTRSRMKDVALGLQKAGFVAVNVEYSLAPRFRYPANLEDLQEAVRWSRRNARRFRGDAQFVAAYGYSAGGHLALLLGTHQAADKEGRVQAVISGGAPVDFFLMPDSSSMKRVFGVSRAANPGLYREVSPLSHITSDDPPVFIYHGADDWIIDVEHARRMAGGLREAGVNVELVEYPRGHLTAELWKEEALEPSIAFLRKQLAVFLAQRNAEEHP